MATRRRDGGRDSSAPVGPSTRTWFVVAANVLGGCQGTTGPSSITPDGREWGSRFPYVTIRDQVDVEARLLEHLGVTRWRPLSAGRWEDAGHRVGGLPSRSCRPQHRARQHGARDCGPIAWCQPQLLIQQDPDYAGGDYYRTGRSPEAGLGLARRIAHITYRTESELGERFSRDPQLREDPLRSGDRGRFAVESYLDHHAGKLARRFDGLWCSPRP